MNYRTDLAVELDEMLTAARGKGSDVAGGDVAGGNVGGGNVGGVEGASATSRNITGYIRKQSQIDEDISVIDIEITDEAGARAFGKPRGRYVTLEIRGLTEQKNGIKERAAAALAEELGKFVKRDYYLKALVVGLGNEKVTPDSLGPHTADKVKITSHLFELFGCRGDFDYSNVCGFNPSVTGVTGLETAELINRVVSMASPDVVIAIDALAAKDIRRLSTTIQICDTGIMPGAGMGNHRKEITEKTVGCPVISIGVPTVIDARTLVLDAAAGLEEADATRQDEAEQEAAGQGAPEQEAAERETAGQNAPGQETAGRKRNAAARKKIENYLEEACFDMIVTSTDIDEIIKDFADIISNAINITLHPGIYSKVK